MAVMFGGHAFLNNPGLGASVGADATAADGRQVAPQAEALLALQSRRAPG